MCLCIHARMTVPHSCQNAAPVFVLSCPPTPEPRRTPDSGSGGDDIFKLRIPVRPQTSWRFAISRHGFANDHRERPGGALGARRTAGRAAAADHTTDDPPVSAETSETRRPAAVALAAPLVAGETPRYRESVEALSPAPWPTCWPYMLRSASDSVPRWSSEIASSLRYNAVKLALHH